MAILDYISYIVGSSCKEETKNVVKYEREEAFVESFEYLGEIAITLLIQNEDVVKAFEDYIKFIDESILLELLEY